MMHHQWRHRRPPWWPEDESWPPMGPARMKAWRHMRGRFFWRVGGLMILLFAFAVVGFTVLLWAIITLLGLSGAPRAALLVGPVLPVLVVLIGVFGIIATGRALRRVTRPVGDVMEAAGRVAEGDYAVRVTERGPPEVRSLAKAFNTMVGRLQVHDEQRRRLLSEITHDLRTPLTVIQGNLEGILDDVYPRDDAHLLPILEEVRLLARLVEDLRTLAQAESGGLELHREPTDLRVLIAETVASFQGQADASGVTLLAEVERALPSLEVDPARIRQVLGNLLANALHHTPRSGTIRLTGSMSAQDGHQRAVISVSDTGSGISPEDLPHVFDRFYKSSESRGSGLGLTIARSLVVAHGGEIFAGSEVGQGTTIRFALPLGQ